MSILPGAILPNYAYLASGDAAPANGIFVPLASLTGLTPAEANATSGDGRKVAFELCRAMFVNLDALPTANRPSRFTITRGIPAGIDQTIVRQTYTLSFDIDFSGSDVAAEP
ncbi:hypothetical protein P7L53_00475 [Thermoleptolyngbya sichuanensis XZ-Cy5]|uniref:hypothetical protein n=1 Tax=Thermoleptolyngbya sichuanensis TaxID=2885951 RepID=UPI00240CECCD|nr:hypothetical protein [Thermoleptolyngbya sichuanensis]MDG2614706.1 hypothetical protein [Thermoleptolyngbya sichuanensis XZ-Cy5]